MAQKKPVEKQAKDRTILINFVLDKSGSMDSIRSATISGFNEFKNDQVREEGHAFMTLTLFDTGFNTTAEAMPVREVPDLTTATYRPSGCTALYDAIGHTIRMTDDFVTANHPDQVLFVIMTDGFENSSREFDRARIFQMIEDRQNLMHYEFIYLGANQDAYEVGMDMGIRQGRMLSYDANEEDMKLTMARTSANVKAYRRVGSPQAPEMFSPAFENIAVDDGVSLEEKKRAYAEEQARRASSK